MHDATYKLEQLAEAAGTSPRTVRYYVQRGLLPAPEFRGKDTVYSGAHLTILGAIRELQARHLPLDAIRAELEGRAPAEIARHIAGLPPPPAQSAPALTPMSRVSEWQLAHGLTLYLSDDASPEARRLADQLLQLATSMNERKITR